jgi:hypothetical protein
VRTDVLVPQPSEFATRINETATATLASGEQVTFTFEAENRSQDLYLPIVAISKFPGFSYEIRRDGSDVYGPARIPPTDIDDLEPCFMPALDLSEKMKVVVSNLSDRDRVVHTQAVGWEPPGDS